MFNVICIVLMDVLLFLCGYLYCKYKPMKTHGELTVDFDYTNKKPTLEVELDVEPVFLKDNSYVIFSVNNKTQNKQSL